MPTTISQERQLELSHAVNRLSEAILRGDTTSDVLHSLVDIAGPMLHADRALIFDVQFKTQLAVSLCEWLRPGSGDVPHKQPAYPLRLFRTAVYELTRTGEPLESSRSDVSPLLVADRANELLHGQMSIQRLLWYPFGRHDNGFYVLALNQIDHDREWGPDEREFVEVVANQVSLGLMKLQLLRERDQSDGELRRSENRFRMFYDSTPSMFFTVDTAGAVRSVNQYATQHLGYSAAELLGQSVLQIVHPEDRNVVMHHLAACFNEPGVVREQTFRKICKDGSTMWVKETTRVADGPEGSNALIVCDDITEQRAHEEAARRAESKSHDKDEFMAMLGHELRNPLTPIVTALEILRRRGRHDDELELIDRQVAHLRRLVDDLLDVSRITRGKVDLNTEHIELSLIAAQAVEVARPLFQRKRQRLTVEMAARGLVVDADPSRLVQAFANLLTNAAKFSDENTEVFLSAERRGDRVIVEVRDQGEGIEPEMLDRVFDLFVQRGQPADRAQSGLGLGLTIVRNLITLHGGTVRALSEGRGRGTVVVVDLPLAPAVMVPARNTSPGTAGRALRGGAARNILVVDDNDDVRKSLCKLLGLHGYQAVGAGDGPSALKIAEELQPLVVLVDIGLPGMDGYEFARRLQRTQPSGPRLVAITGYGQPSDRARSRDAGFVAHLVKPVDIDTLLPLLESGGATPPDGPHAA
jgi:PAS domain S-box-containing protein